MITNRNANRLEFERLLVSNNNLMTTFFTPQVQVLLHYTISCSGWGQDIHASSQSSTQHAAQSASVVRLFLVQVNYYFQWNRSSKIMNFFLYQCPNRGRIQGGGDINTALGLLPDKLKTELALHVNLSVLKKVSIPYLTNYEYPRHLCSFVNFVSFLCKLQSRVKVSHSSYRL